MAEVTQTEGSIETLPLLDRIVAEGRMARRPDQETHAKGLVGEFATQILEEKMPVKSDTIAMIQDRIARIDEEISQQLNEIMHHEDFQQLEASWRGMHYLVFHSETGEMLKLRVLNLSKQELLKDLEQAIEFDQSALFKLVYEEKYGTFGGHPYTLLVGDFEFTSHPQDVGLLEKLSNVAAAAHAPFISMCGPGLFDMDGFTDLGKPRDLAKIFESTLLVKWRSFRQSEDARYVALTMPHILMRLPYGKDFVPVEDFDYEEDVDGTDHRKYLWGNAAWGLAARITDAFAKYQWMAAIRGVEGGGVVEGLPAHTFKTDEGDVALKCPTEIAITDRRENELNNLGFIALVHCRGTDYACFFGAQTVQTPRKYDDPQATANAALSARLPYILAASRFAHYIKAIMRDKVGSFATAETVSAYLNRWVGNYVLGKDDAGQELKARYPLREARVDVSEIPGKPGSYNAVIFLRPHFQLEDLTASIRLVAELPPPAV